MNLAGGTYAMQEAGQILESLTPVYTPVEDGYVQAQIVELPGVITVGRDRRDAELMLLDALRLYAEVQGVEAPYSIVARWIGV